MHQELKLLSALVLGAATLIAHPAHAEEPATRISGEATFALPLGKLSDAANPAVGAFVRLEHRITPSLDATASLGALYFVPKDVGGPSVSMLAIPLLVGVRVPLGESGPFATGEIGISRLSAHTSGTVAGVDASGSSDAEVKGTLLVGAGYRFGALDVRGALGSLDVGHFGDTMFVGLYGGWAFAAF